MKTLTLFIALFTTTLTFGQDQIMKDSKGVFFRLNPITSVTHVQGNSTSWHRDYTTGEIYTNEHTHDYLEPGIGIEFGAGYTFNKYVNTGIFFKGLRPYNDISTTLFAGLMVEYTPHSLVGLYARGGTTLISSRNAAPTYGAGLNLNIPVQSESFTIGFRAGVDYYKLKYEHYDHDFGQNDVYHKYSIDLGINLKWQL